MKFKEGDFKITGPGFYKRRDGKKAEVLKLFSDGSGALVWVEEGEEHYTVFSRGSFWPNHTKDIHDIVSSWVEPVVVECVGTLEADDLQDPQECVFVVKLKRDLILEHKGKEFKLRAELLPDQEQPRVLLAK